MWIDVDAALVGNGVSEESFINLQAALSRLAGNMEDYRDGSDGLDFSGGSMIDRDDNISRSAGAALPLVWLAFPVNNESGDAYRSSNGAPLGGLQSM